jgi:hypothetical protein
LAALNEELDWKQIASDPKVSGAFLRPPVKTILNPGTSLCRFITTLTKNELKEGDKGEFNGRWWIEWRFAVAEINRWRTLRASPKDVLRGRFAVTTEFSSKLDSMLQIVLSKPVFAWKGTARYQEDSIQRVTYLGGAEQLYIPNLASDDSGFSSNVAYMHCFTAIESFG